MSTLLNVKIPITEKVVKVSDSEGFAVRGLSPFQVVGLYKRHAGELEPLFQRVIAGARQQGEAQVADIEAIVMSLLSESPVILAELIVLGSGGDPSDTSTQTVTDPATGDDITLSSFEAALLVARHLPFPVQVDALQKVGELTFTSEMPPGKFLTLVTSLAKKVTSAMRGLTSPQA